MTEKEFDEWISALESGEYPKGKDYLCRYGKYCCLGVKAHLDGKLDEEGAVSGDSKFYIPAGMNGNDCDLVAISNDDSDTFDPVIDFLKELKHEGRIEITQ